MSWSKHLENIAALGLGAGLAVWFSYFVWGSEKADGAAHLMTAIWVPATFLKLWIDKKAKNG